MAFVYLGIGSNLGDRKANLQEAVKMLNAYESISVAEVSSFYETEPVGYEKQGMFLNGALSCKATLDPYEFLKFTQEIENNLKRVKTIRWGPRTIDVDILLYGNLELTDIPRLIIPHPRMTEREFVLLPLAEIAPEVIHPPTGKSIKQLLKELKTKET